MVKNVFITGGAGYKGVILADPDRSEFIINFDKISAQGFAPTISIEEGIQELLRLYSWYQPFRNYRPI